MIDNSLRLGARAVSLISGLALCAFASAGLAQAPVKAAADGTLTDGNGMTLYTFDRDAGGKSACIGPCRTNWPPLMASADSKPMGDWTVITRDDGGNQWAYKGKPLYTWSKDTKPGDKTGDGFNSVWHTAKQ